MVIRRIFLLLITQVFILCASAQDQVNFSQFFLSPYLINPSYAGIDGKPLVGFTYRKQWAAVEGGPTIANLNFHTPIGKRLSTGFSATNDQRGVLNNSSLLISFSYNVPLQNKIFVRFGISAGGSWNTVDLEKLSMINDPKLPTLLNNHAALIGNAGISAHIKSFHFGVSMPLIFKPSYVSTDALTITEVEPFQALLFHVSQRFYFNSEKHVFEPHFIYRLNEGLPSQFEVAGVIHLNHVIWAGASYKQDFGISALGGIKLNNSFAIGGAYSIENTGINELNSPSYEIGLNFLFGQRRKETPMYSFVNTLKEKEKKPIRKSASELIAERRKQQEMAAKQNAKKKPETLSAENEVRKSPANVSPTSPASEGQSASDLHRPRFSQSTDIPALQGQNYYEEELLRRLELHSGDPKEQHEYSIDDYPNANKHEFIKKGDHSNELEVSNYVIAGNFRDENRAKTFADGLLKSEFSAKYGYSSSKGLWFVYIFRADNINQVKRERDKFRKMKVLRDSWIVTIRD